MSTLSLRLSESLHKAVKQLAKKEHISINQLIALALAEKLSALETVDYLGKRANRGNRSKYLDILNNAPDINPDEEDKI